jgi:glycosyltransferase involved in cell wall biosynthesis
MTTLHNYFKIDLAFDHPRCAVQVAWWLWSRALRRFARRVCISAAMQRYYRRALPTLRFDLAYNFRATSMRRTAELPAHIGEWFEKQRGRARLVLVYVGALGPRKNVARLLEILAETPEIALVLCGDGPQASVLRARAGEPDLVDRVMFTGHVSEPADIVGASDALVLPSLAEGLPLVVLEAAQAGRPALMSNIAVHRELASLGFGTTFDRHRFVDFRAKAHALAGRPGRPPDPALVALWRQHFSPEPGFKKYAELSRKGEVVR